MDENTQGAADPNTEQVIPELAGFGPSLSVDDVAKVLGLAPRSVRTMAVRGELPAFKIGRVWRVRRSVLEQLMLGRGDREDDSPEE